MTHPPYLREKAIQLRVERKLSIDEIAERLALPKTTIYCWVSHIPLQRDRRSGGQVLGTLAMQANFRRKREDAYADGAVDYDALRVEPTFRDFVAMYIAEGYKRSRNTVSLSNSDPIVIRLATHWIRRFAIRPPSFRVQHHADQDPDELRAFWGAALNIDPGSVELFRKSNSGELRGRTWRCVHGVMQVAAYDTLFRARLQAWMDSLQRDWLTLAV